MRVWLATRLAVWLAALRGRGSARDFGRVLDEALRHTDRITIRLRALERAQADSTN